MDVEEEEDDEDDLDEDEDMMDKISSSPSIDEGRYSLPTHTPTTRTAQDSTSDGKVPYPSFYTPAASSSPFLDTPVYYPLSILRPFHPSAQARHHDHHLLSSKVGYLANVNVTPENRSGAFANNSCFPRPPRVESLANLQPEPITRKEVVDVYDGDFPDPYAYIDSMAEVRHTSNIPGVYDEDELMIPYVSEEEEDDTCPPHDPSRFVDSGWGGDCLQELEDIDFEFVYALHTFKATVEGQADAAKGDTMVLLDDSNSYWWLVRVVKDSSIGMCVFGVAEILLLYFRCSTMTRITFLAINDFN